MCVCLFAGDQFGNARAMHASVQRKAMCWIHCRLLSVPPVHRRDTTEYGHSSSDAGHGGC